MNKKILKMTLEQTAQEKFLKDIPKELPKADLSKDFIKRFKNTKKKKRVHIITAAAAVALIIICTPIVYNHYKPLKEVYVCPSTIKTGSLVVNMNGDRNYTNDTTIVSSTKVIETTHSKEWQKNMDEASKQNAILKSIKNFDEYNNYFNCFNEEGKLVVMYWNNDSYEIMKKHLDPTIVIFKKVKFSNDYLFNIQTFLTDYMEEYEIGAIGGPDDYNQVKILIANKNREKDILDLLYNNIKDFDEKAVRFEYGKNQPT